MRFSEKLLQNSGITVVPVDLLEITNEANNLLSDKKLADNEISIKEKTISSNVKVKA